MRTDVGQFSFANTGCELLLHTAVASVRSCSAARDAAFASVLTESNSSGDELHITSKMWPKSGDAPASMCVIIGGLVAVATSLRGDVCAIFFGA